MSTPDTNNIGIKLQAVGENLNTWGAPNLNNDFSVVSNISSGFNPITINGDYNVAANETNYATNNPSEYATIKLVAGTVSAAFNFVWANRPKRTLLWNATAFAAQMKLTASTGFSLPAGAYAWISTDGATDVYNVSSSIIAGPLTVAGQIHGVATGTATTDAVNKTQMETAIATAGIPASAGTVLVDSLDTTAGYLASKLTVQFSGLTTTQVAGLTNAQWSTANIGGNEQRALVIGAGYVGAFLNGGTKSAQFTPVVGTEYVVDFTASSFTVNLAGMTTPQVGQRIKIDCFGNFQPFLLGTVNGQANLFIDAGFSGELCYSSATWGWN